MEQREALALLDEVQRVRRRAKSGVGGLWFPLVVFGALSVLSTPVHGAALGLYWAAAMPIGVALVAFYYYRREQALGVESRPAPVAWAVGVIIVGTAVTLACSCSTNRRTASIRMACGGCVT